MKICAVTTWPPHRDGVALYSAQLYEHICEKVNVKVLANVVDSFREISGIEENCEVIRCWRRGSIIYPFRIFSKILMERPDIIHLQHGWLLYGDKFALLLFPLLLMLLRLTGKPIVVTMHTIIGENPRFHESKIVNFMAKIVILFTTRTIVKLSHRIIVHNFLMKRVLEDLYSLRKEGEKILVIPHGVREKPQKTRKDGGIEKNRILSIGFLRKEKGVEHLVEAFRIFSDRYPEATLIFAGGKHAHNSEDYISLLKKRFSSKLKNIIFAGFVDEKTLDNLILESKVIVLPSSGKHFIEASGVLSRVAMYGKPIICSRVPKFEADLEDGKDCIMVDMDDPNKLSEALSLLMSDENLRRKMGRNLRRKFRDRVWSKVAEQHINLFKNLLTVRDGVQFDGN